MLASCQYSWMNCHAKRLECAELAPAFEPSQRPTDIASKLGESDQLVIALFQRRAAQAVEPAIKAEVSCAVSSS